MSRKHCLQIFRSALEASDPQHAVLRRLSFDGQTLTAGRRRYNLQKVDRVLVIGAGKGSAAMASAVERILGRRITGGLVNVPDGVKARVRRVKLQPARHPLPDERGMKGAMDIAEMARTATGRDLVIALISGGASAMLPAPVPPLTLADKQELSWNLMRAGANIHELNTVRKHLSLLKGGQLASISYPARMISLILSDVIGDDLDVIGSGPTVGDRATVADAKAVLDKFDVKIPGVKHPEHVLRETPKPGDQSLSRVQNLIVGSNALAVDAARAKALELGYQPVVLSTTIDGETRDIARMHAAIAREALKSTRRRPVAFLSGGETTVTVRGKGKGGRNQEFVLAAAIALAKEFGEGAPVTVFSGGTDGLDGPTDAAGAVADARMMSAARKLGLNPQAFLDANDAYNFFAPVHGLVKTGPTGTNVMDVRVLLVGNA